MTDISIAEVSAFECALKELPQCPIETHHVIHGGMYHRTIMIPRDVALTGVLVKIPTTLVFSGESLVYTGDGVIHLKGYQVIPASAGRKQAFHALSDSWLTMSFPTDAQTVEEAEREFTDEFDQLMSHGMNNFVVITGESK